MVELPDQGMVHRNSPYCVDETVERLDGVLQSLGIPVLARIDHSGGAAAMAPTRIPPFAPVWTAVTSPGSSTSLDSRGGQRSSTRRPQCGQAHSSASGSTRPLRIISCVCAAAFIFPVSPGRRARANLQPN